METPKPLMEYLQDWKDWMFEKYAIGMLARYGSMEDIPELYKDKPERHIGGIFEEPPFVYGASINLNEASIEEIFAFIAKQINEQALKHEMAPFYYDGDEEEVE